MLQYNVPSPGRLFRQCITSPINGVTFEIVNDTNLQNSSTRGHRWFVLKWDTPDEVCTRLSDWRNRDQNTAQVKHEVEHIKGIQRVCINEAKLSRQLVLATIVSKTMAVLQLKTSSAHVLVYAKFVVHLGFGEFVDDICEHHSAEVNPNELTVPPSLYYEVCAAKDCVTTQPPEFARRPPLLLSL